MFPFLIPLMSSQFPVVSSSLSINKQYITREMVPMEDAMAVLMEELVQPLLPVKMDHKHKPSISQQEAVAKQVRWSRACLFHKPNLFVFSSKFNQIS